jgi:nondiscriminating glutamyl-tRNA synthetase
MMSKIRTRFAPSPTGFLHVGGLRTALYNYLFARHHQGDIVLRIEDTDRTRFVEGATESLIHTMKIMGIDYNEGPAAGGSLGPYLQSQRTDIYQKFARTLLDQGDAYYCFCSVERLEKMRQDQESAGQQPRYDSTCRNLNAAEIRQNLENEIPHVVRLKMPQEGITRFTDLVRGEVAIQNELTDDQILIKSDGYPTYHLANVVDDHLMQISHVIRGEEWLLSVPKHLRLYEAFGWEPPRMAHLPLLLNPDRSKLSKRQGDVAVEDFLEKGYLPEALNNFIALLGWNPGTDQEIFTLSELINLFSLERVNKSGAIFDLHKLNWMNSQYIRQLPVERRHTFLATFIRKVGYDTTDEQKTVKVADAIYMRVANVEDIEREAAIFYSDRLEITEKDARDILQRESSRKVLTIFLEQTDKAKDLTVDVFKSVMKEVQQQTGIKKQDLWMPVRVALTGVTHGPELPQVIEILGKERIRNFVKQALNLTE